MNDIRMILCDIDGTLLSDNKDITEKTINVISKLKEKNILFGIATGRSPIAVKELLDGWKIKDHVDILMGFNGAQYFDFALGKEERSHLVDGEILRDVISKYNSFDVSFGVFDNHIFHATRADQVSKMIAANNKLTMEIDDLSPYLNSQATKMLIMGQSEVIDEVEKFHAKNLDERYRGVRSTKNLFEILNPSVSKSFGIERIAQNHGFTLENVCVFGDELNDLEMIKDCGVGVCMENGNPLVKEVADYITDSNNDDGVGNFIEKYIIKN